jgi:hypothetical protein
MGEIKGMIGKIGSSMVALPTRMISESTAIVRVSEGVTETRDKLPLVGTTRMNNPPKALNTAANSGLHMGVVKPRNGSVPTNSKPTDNKDLATGLRVDNTTPSDTRRKVNEVMGSIRDPVTIIGTLGNVKDTTATGAPTGVAMSMDATVNARNTTAVAPTGVAMTVNARRVIGVVNTGPLVAGTRGLHTNAEMKVLGSMKAPRTLLVPKGIQGDVDTRGLQPDSNSKAPTLSAMEKGSGPMEVVETAKIRLVSKGSTCKVATKITRRDKGSMVIGNGMGTRRPNTDGKMGMWKFEKGESVRVRVVGVSENEALNAQHVTG